ncbi:hypothetical protein ACF0H5_008773 [Mactra antiquata]
MLIHGRLLVTEHGLMLDEVKSLLQKALRRQEHELAFKATKELMAGGKDQPKYESIVIFMFEDHCLNHVTVFESLLFVINRKDKKGCIELISKCYTSRMSACLQVVAISDKYRDYRTFWKEDLHDFPELCGLISTKNNGIDCDLLLQNFVKNWREKNIDALISLFGLLNMAVKVEERPLTTKGIKYLIDHTIKKPSLYHLVLSALKKNTQDEYMIRVIRICYKFASLPKVQVGLITITVLSQLMYKDLIQSKPIPDMKTAEVNWEKIGMIETMPHWAVDKHTYRGKYGKSSRELFLKKYRNIKMSEQQLKEFHGERPKVDIRSFFEVGTLCKNEILPDNPYWGSTKAQYLKQIKSLQKCAKMTNWYYFKLRDSKSLVFSSPTGTSSSAQEGMSPQTNTKRKRKLDDESEVDLPDKRRKVTGRDEPANVSEEIATCSTAESSLVKDKSKTLPTGPLLQLPTGSGKVYTILDEETKLVWKGPYKVKERQNLCLFYHKAMRDVFGDSHTLEINKVGKHLVFPLLKSNNGVIRIERRAFYDCISKSSISERDGSFIERSSLGIVQLHRLTAETMQILPVSIWAHFVWRYVLNVGDSGLYNAIATKGLDKIYGIDMEERRGSVKGNDLLNMMFTKLPRRDLVKEIESAILLNIEQFHALVNIDINFDKLKSLYDQFGLKNEIDVCKERIGKVLNSIDVMCKKECGI